MEQIYTHFRHAVVTFCRFFFFWILHFEGNFQNRGKNILFGKGNGAEFHPKKQKKKNTGLGNKASTQHNLFFQWQQQLKVAAVDWDIKHHRDFPRPVYGLIISSFPNQKLPKVVYIIPNFLVLHFGENFKKIKKHTKKQIRENLHK